MKKLLTIFLMLITVAIFAQEQDDSIHVYKSGWNLSLGGTYPRYMTVSFPTIADHSNYGLYASLGFDISEHIGFRLLGNFISLDSYWLDSGEIHNRMNQASLNLDVLYKILPCEVFIPYVMLGYGLTMFESDNGYLKETRQGVVGSKESHQLRFGGGLEWRFVDDLSFKVEADYATASNNKIDGNEHINEVKGILQSNGDTYITLDVGATWYFARGDRSHICEPYGIREIIREVPVEIEKIVIDTVYIRDAIVGAVQQQKSFVLENVRFKFDKDVLTNEARIILSRVASVLKDYPDEKIEILGHTDNIGDDQYNMDLSERRALSVENYLISKGVNGDRLYPAGCGERKPITDNSTEIGRAINRRIEFRIYDGVSSACPKLETQSDRNGAHINDAIENGKSLILEGVHFKFNSDELTEESTKILTNAANVLSQYPSAPIEIHGHTDNIGNGYYNKDLSLRRAISVKNFLVSKGIVANRMSTFGHGEELPIDDNGTDYGRARNRRMEFKLTSGYKESESNITNEEEKVNSETKSTVKIETVSKDTREFAEVTLSAEAKKMEADLLNNDKFILNNLHFAFDKDILVEESTQILVYATSVLKKHSNININIEGHTDNIGADDYNQYLSIMRANAVKKYLIENGIAKARLTTKGFGEKKPVANNNTNAGRVLNRRIEFSVVK